MDWARHTRHTRCSGTSGRRSGMDDGPLDSSRRDKSNEPYFESITLSGMLLKPQMYSKCVAGTFSSNYHFSSQSANSLNESEPSVLPNHILRESHCSDNV